MAEQKPFEVEVAVDAPPDRVWAVLTNPTEIRRWHGWIAETLDDEIQYIYVDHADRLPPDRIELRDGEDSQTIELIPDGARTRVRITRPGSLPADDRYDPIEEGWRSFFQQMRHYLEEHSGQDRRTVFLNGKAVASEVAEALDARLPGRRWFEDMFQRGVITEEYGDGLLVLAAQEPLASDRPGAVHITLTTYGLDDAAFGRIQDDWWTWWSNRVDKPEVTVG